MSVPLDPHPNAPVELAELSGTVLERRYSLGRILGAGGMGAVFEARDLRLERAVAIKVLRPVFVGHDEYIKRFLREAQAASKIRHRNVVVILDYGEAAGGLVYSVMELFVGRDLEQLLRAQPKQRLPWAHGCELLVQIASGLRAAHRQGVIHRDIKPANCFVTTEDDELVVKVVDFGIAKVEDAGKAQLTSTGNLLGTPSYIAPELIRTHSPASPRSDVYSLGVLAFRMLTGHLPFTGETAFELMRSACMDPPPSPRSLVPELPAEVEGLVLQMLAKAPEDRPGDMGVVRERLHAIAPQTLGAHAVEIPVSSVLPVEAEGAEAEDRATLPRSGSALWGPVVDVIKAVQAGVLPAVAPRHAEPPGTSPAVAAAETAVPRVVHDPASFPSRSGETLPTIGEATLRLVDSSAMVRPHRRRWGWAAGAMASVVAGMSGLTWVVMTDERGEQQVAPVEASVAEAPKPARMGEEQAVAKQDEANATKVVKPTPGADVFEDNGPSGTVPDDGDQAAGEVEGRVNDAKPVDTLAVDQPSKPISKPGKPKLPTSAGPPSDNELKKKLTRKIKNECAVELAGKRVTVVFDVTTSGEVKRLTAMPKGAAGDCAKRQVAGAKFRMRGSETNIAIEAG